MGTATQDLPLFGRTAPGHRSDAAADDLRQHEEVILYWRGNGMHHITVTVAQDPLGEWWSSYGWGISADVPSGTVGSHTPLATLGPGRDEAIDKALRALADCLPDHSGAAGRQVAQLRAHLAPLLRLRGALDACLGQPDPMDPYTEHRGKHLAGWRKPDTPRHAPVLLEATHG